MLLRSPLPLPFSKQQSKQKIDRWTTTHRLNTAAGSSLSSVIGVAVFYWSDNTVGTIIILASMVFKIIECGLRFLK